MSQMGNASQAEPLAVKIRPNTTADGLPPSHHVLAPAPGTSLSSYLPHWNPQPTTSSQQQNGESSQSAQLQDDNDSQNIACLPNSIALVDPTKVVRTGFRNPWPSWHKPTVTEVWQGLEWGEDQDTAIDYAMQDADFEAGSRDGNDSTDPYKDSRPGTPDLEGTPPDSQAQGLAQDGRSKSWFSQQTVPSSYTRQQKIKMASKQLLTIQEPSFDLDSDAKLKATWLGHAGVLVQLPPLTPTGQPIRILFDPIFSQRCSPTQVAGPIRSYAPPCPISSLPPIDLVIISHNHYDHLDYDTVRELWTANKDRLRFIVPLGNKDWFIGSAAGDSQAQQPAPGTTTSPSTESLSSSWSFTPSAATTSALSIPAERVTELDWWDEVHLTQAGADAEEGQALRVVCTPAQHGSGRYGVDANCALWSSWFLEHPSPKADGSTTKLYFGGDTGCQFHGPSFPPAPPPAPASGTATPASESGDALFPNPPLRSHPTYRGGTHLTPDDELASPYPPCPAFSEIVTRLGHPALLMLPISVGATISFLRSYVPLPDSLSPFPRLTPGLTAANHMPPWDAVRVFDQMTTGPATCMAIHWGTFISGPEEVLKTLGQLKWACAQMGVRFARGEDASDGGERGGKTFVALNHGGSITL